MPNDWLIFLLNSLCGSYRMWVAAGSSNWWEWTRRDEGAENQSPMNSERIFFSFDWPAKKESADINVADRSIFTAWCLLPPAIGTFFDFVFFLLLHFWCICRIRACKTKRNRKEEANRKAWNTTMSSMSMDAQFFFFFFFLQFLFPYYY